MKKFELGNPPTMNKQSPADEWYAIQNFNEYLENSIITDSFQGRMHSYFKCDRCTQLSKIEEYFTYLDLRLPKVKDLSKLKKWGFEAEFLISNPNGSKVLDSEKIKDDKYRFLHSSNKASKDVISLYEILADFFETKVIKVNSNFFCPVCKDRTTYEKKYRYHNLPNVMTFNIKRRALSPTENHKVILPLTLDLSLFHTNPNEKNAVYQLVGYIENRGNDQRSQYVATTRNLKNKQWYQYDDSEWKIIDEKLVVESYASLVFYARILSSEREKECQNIRSQFKVLREHPSIFEGTTKVFVPNYWYEKFLSLASPGMVHTTQLLCPHGVIKPSYYDCFPTNSKPNTISNSPSGGNLNSSFGMDSSFSSDRSFMSNIDFEEANYTKNLIEKQSIKLPKEIGEYLLEKYGGGPLFDDIRPCEICTTWAVNVKQRKRLERDLITKYDNKVTKNFCIVSQDWINRWKNFLYTNNKFLRRNFIKGHNPPGPIFNDYLFDNEGKIAPGLIRGTHYRVVNEYVWKIFKALYNGGPDIVRKERDIYSQESQLDSKIELTKIDKDLLEDLKKLVTEPLKITKSILPEQNMEDPVINEINVEIKEIKSNV